MPMKIIGTAVDYLFGGVRVGAAAEDRLRRCLASPAPDLVLPHARTRYVVVDVETNRADRRRDPLIALGAIGVTQMHVVFADCFAVVLRRERASADAGVLVHGVGGQAQLEGTEPAQAMLDFLEFLGKAPLVAFAADHDRGAVEHAVKSILGVPLRYPWIDLGGLLSTLFPGADCNTPDQWLARFGLAAGTWHDALADALALAQLLQIALDAAIRAGLVNARQLIDLPRPARPPAGR